LKKLELLGKIKPVETKTKAEEEIEMINDLMVKFEELEDVEK